MIRTLLATAFVLTTTAAFAAPLGPSKPSDVQRAFSDGNATCSGGNGRPVTKTYDADGQVTTFTIPPKNVLIVTQVDWFVDNAGAAQTATLELTMFPVGASASTLMDDGGTSDANGKIRKVTLTSPLVVPAGATMCVKSNLGNVGAFVHGYFTKAK